MATTTQAARYRHLSDEDLTHLTPTQLAVYQAERAHFDREVEAHVKHMRDKGWIDVGTKGREVKFYVPVKLTPREPAHRDTLSLGRAS